MVELSEPQLYDLYSSKNGTENILNKFMSKSIRIFVKHLKEEHDMGIREIAKKMGMKEKSIKGILSENE